MADGALGQTTERLSESDAQQLLERARKAFLAGDYAVACPKYEELVRGRPGLGARMGLGDCYRMSGRLASAWEVYEAIVADAPGVEAAATKPKDRTTAQQRAIEAARRMSEIEPKLAWLVLDIPEETRALSDLRIQRDGITIPKEKWGSRLPVDGGDHVVFVQASNRKNWQKSIHVTTDSGEIKVVIGPLAKEGAKAAVDGLDPESPDDKAEQKEETSRPGLGARIAGATIGVLGLGAIGVGSYFGLRAIHARDASVASGHCDAQSFCDPVGKDMRIEGRTSGNISTALFIGGSIAVGVGIVLLATAPKKESEKHVELTVGPGSIGFRGKW